MSQVEDENKEGELSRTKPQYDFNHSLVWNKNENKFVITSTEKISKDVFLASFDVDYLKLCAHVEFPEISHNSSKKKKK